jgi:hypothetical protein
VVAILRKDRIKAKDFTGRVEVGCCHDETINKGGSLVRGRLNGIQKFKGASNERRGTVGKQYVSGCVTGKNRLTGHNRRMSANVVPDTVERLGKDLGGKDDVAICVGDNLRYRIGFLVPEILDVDLGNQGTGIKDNNGLTHGL